MEEPVLLEGSPSDRHSIPLATKRGCHIPNFRREPRDTSAMEDAVRWNSESHESVRVRSKSSTYNCVGMVFANRRTWVETDHIRRILEEDGYRPVTLQDAECGDIVLYTDADADATVLHVGVIVRHDPSIEDADWKTTVLSQWGRDGEFFHELKDVNTGLLGSPNEVWTERL